MTKSNFVLYKDFNPTLKLLTNEQAGILIKAVFDYVEDRTEPDFNNDGMVLMAFSMLKTQLERDLVKYKNTVLRNQENGKKGGRPKNKDEETHSVISKPKEPTGIKSNPKKAKKADSDSDSVSDKIGKDNKYYDNLELNDLFIDFLKQRKKLKAVNSERAINGLLNKLKPFSDEIKIQMIDNALVGSWKTVYELKTNGKNNDRPDIESDWLDDYIGAIE